MQLTQIELKVVNVNLITGIIKYSLFESIKLTCIIFIFLSNSFLFVAANCVTVWTPLPFGKGGTSSLILCELFCPNPVSIFALTDLN